MYRSFPSTTPMLVMTTLSRVRFELTEKDIESYRRAADFLNINNVDLVCLQHEYGIFGGRAGSHILALLRELRMPIVTTLHTILVEPDADQRRVLEEVARLSDRLVVMSRARQRIPVQKSIMYHPTRSILFPTAFRMCLLSIRVSTKTCLESKGKWSCSASGCSRQAKGLRMSSKLCPPLWPIIPTWSI